MATDHPMRRGTDDHLSENRRMQRALLAFVLDQFPNRLTRFELPLALDAKDPAEKDAVTHAVRELAAVELLRIEGDWISPSRPALYFQWLESE
jgi:hypothetical protein